MMVLNEKQFTVLCGSFDLELSTHLKMIPFTKYLAFVKSLQPIQLTQKEGEKEKN